MGTAATKPRERTEADQIVDEKLLAIWDNSVLAFAEDILPHMLVNKVPEFHKDIYELLPKEKRVVLAAPRGFAKSYICSFIYPLHQALFEHKRDITIISASESLAIEHLRKIRLEIEGNQGILYFWGDMRSGKWTENHLILKNGVNIRARGAGGQIRGFRPDCVILDDIETDESVVSEDQRSKLRNWIHRACINVLPPHGQFVMIGTLIHPLALLNEILLDDNGWLKHKFRAYKTEKQEAGNELWPDLWTHERLQARKREIGSFAFSSEFLNNPVTNETAPIRPEQIRFWKELPAQYSCVIAVDPAYSDDEKADFKVASLVAIDQASNRYLVSYIRSHMPLGEFEDAILNMWQSNKQTITGLGIPNSGTEKSFYASFLKRAEQRQMFPPVMELKNVHTNAQTGTSIRNKRARIVAALQPLFEQGKYYIGAQHSEARDELLAIGASRWDDVVDTLAYAEQILQPIYYDLKQYESNYEEETKTFKGDTGYGI